MNREDLEHIIRAAAEKADEIDGSIGEGSLFHESHGYYAQGVGPETACLPAGWETRLRRIQNQGTNGRVGYCLDVLDLFMAKAAANRDKDRLFDMALLEHGYVLLDAAVAKVDDMPLDGGERQKLRARIQRWARALREQGGGIPGK